MRRLIFAVAGLCALLAAFLGGRFSLEPTHVPGPDESTSGVTTKLADLEVELEQARQSAANLKAALDVEREASASIRSDLATAQAQIGQIEQEVDLYRGLLDSSARQSGLGLHSIEIEKTAEANSYRFRLVLVQRTRNYSEIEGTLRLSVRGSQGNASRVLSYADIGVPRGSNSLALRLVYFQVFDGQIELPVGFRPKDVLIDADVTAGKRQRLSVRRDWKPKESP